MSDEQIPVAKIGWEKSGGPINSMADLARLNGEEPDPDDEDAYLEYCEEPPESFYRYSYLAFNAKGKLIGSGMTNGGMFILRGHSSDLREVSCSRVAELSFGDGKLFLNNCYRCTACDCAFFSQKYPIGHCPRCGHSGWLEKWAHQLATPDYVTHDELVRLRRELRS